MQLRRSMLGVAVALVSCVACDDGGVTAPPEIGVVTTTTSALPTTSATTTRPPVTTPPPTTSSPTTWPTGPFDPELFRFVDPDHVILPDPVPVPGDAPPPLAELVREGSDGPPVGDEFDRLWTQAQLDDRRAFGLPASEEAVRAAREAGQPDLAGLALLPDERAIVERQLAFQDAISAYVPAILTAAGERAAGHFLSPGDDLGGRYTILLYRSDLTVDDLTAGMWIPEGLRARIRISPGALPRHYLEAIHVLIHQILAAADVPSHSAADEVRARVQVMVGIGRTGDAIAALPPDLAAFVDWLEGEGIGQGPWGEPLPAPAT